MPRRTDIQSVLIIGSGPIIIGQACEFDYSGTQACKAIREEGYKVILVNSNPATIMTDPETAHRTYIEPITPDMVAKIIEAERPDALLPTLGGQTGLNTAVELADRGVLDAFGVRMLGANRESIHKAEDRELFKKTMDEIGLTCPQGGFARNMDEARKILEFVELPAVIRPSFTLGGTGGGIAYNHEEFETICKRGLEYSLIHEILIERSVIGWKEYELEVMRDKADNFVVICSIENFDPMGVHTGDSITVAPAQTLTDREYQLMRDASAKIIRAIGVETGGSNIQFGVNPKDGEMVVVEMNPRVSRSSALASKATGFPIAKIAAKLAVGYTLDEIPNDITRETCAGFEPTIDYVVVKVPRWTFEKFPDADPILTTQMKSVGEVMAIGRTFKEALQKAIRGLEIGRAGLGLDRKDALAKGGTIDEGELRAKLQTPNDLRLFYIRYALRKGMPAEQVAQFTKVDPWFIAQLSEILELESELCDCPSLYDASEDLLRRAKRCGFSDRQLAFLWQTQEAAVRKRRIAAGVTASYKLVDTCAAEFEAYTPYYYSTYEAEDEARRSNKKKIMILGGGPNRIGQGIEFDYCCVQAAFAVREMGFESVMVNSNPETVSTDYDTSDLLFFEPLTCEDVLNIADRLQPDGIIVQFGGQTPLNLARSLLDAGAPIIGTSVESIERAEDRDLFNRMVKKLNLRQPPSGMASDRKEAADLARSLGFPVITRPSFVLGGRAMAIIHGEDELAAYLKEGIEVSEDRPVMVDKFLENAIEVDVDAVADGETVVIGGILEHIEQAGIHSGDAAMAIPPFSLGASIIKVIEDQTVALGRELDVRGLMNIQFAVKGSDVYILEVNPRASRTVPFVSKAIGKPLAKIATKVMLGQSLKKQGFTSSIGIEHVAVKESVFPFNRFPNVDIVLGPEMKSTGEVMGLDREFGLAFAKSQAAAGQPLPTGGTLLLGVRDEDKRAVTPIAHWFHRLGFKLLATHGTYLALRTQGIPVERVNKIQEGRPHVLDYLTDGKIQLLINTPSRLGWSSAGADRKIRSAACMHGIPCITTIAAASAAAAGIEALKSGRIGVRALQDYLADIRK
ncbi:MAG TPA: carbamoyl-phosphate synthase large subunit [Candidatus Brocadiia bacterium]|nr:carbamoyl-phosphate synthase large subunit [Candidatus Brocadiia bacterium]